MSLLTLERCPFCGRPGEDLPDRQGNSRPGCPDPRCAGHSFYEDDATITIEQWNRRPTTDALPPLGAPGHFHYFENDGAGENRFACKCGAWLRVMNNHVQLAGGYLFGEEIAPFIQMANGHA